MVRAARAHRDRSVGAIVEKALAGAFILVGACNATTMTAAGAHEPVVLGPVHCIGCPPAPQIQKAAIPLTTWAKNRSIAVFGLQSGEQGELSWADSLRLHGVGDCPDAVVVSRVRARTTVLSLVPIFLASDTRIEMEAWVEPHECASIRRAEDR